MSQLNPTQLRETLDKSPSDWRVTKDMMERRIKSVDYFQIPGTTVMLCNIVLDTGFSVRGESACVDPANFNKDVGETLAYERAFNQLWAFFGFLLAEQKYRFEKQASDLGMLDVLGTRDGE